MGSGEREEGRVWVRRVEKGGLGERKGRNWVEREEGR